MTSRGFTREQLYSTASYRSKNLQATGFIFNDVSGWDFSGQDLTGSAFAATNVTNADFTDAVIKGASLSGEGFTKEQLYSGELTNQKTLAGSS